MSDIPCTCCGKHFTPTVEEVPVCHRLLCGDATKATDVAVLLEGLKPCLVVTDPPYGVAYDPTWRAQAGINRNDGKMGIVLNDDRHDWSEAYVLAQADVLYVWHGGVHAGDVQQSLENCGFQIVSQIVWVKDRFALSRGDYHWQHEPCWYAVRAGRNHRWQGGRDQATVWEIARADDAGNGHGTQKPLECMARPIRNSSAAGDVIYDPFLGSGTTLVACEQLGRVGMAMELSAEYVAVALQRLCDMGLKPHLVTKGS